MDRDELQDRIRQRRSGGDPYRRGGVADEGVGGYQRFEPEPGDAQARRSLRPGEQRHDALDERDAIDDEGAAAGAAAAAAAASSSPFEPPDITRETDDWTERESLVPPLPPSEPVVPAPFPDERA